MQKKCLQCCKFFEKKPTDSLKVWNNRTKYCSKNCFNLSKQGKYPKNLTAYSFKKGVRNNPQAEFKAGQTANENNAKWKGDSVGYLGIHSWVQRKLGKPDTCEHCGKTGLIGHKIHWANVDHKYKRELKDWLRLCAKCHLAYDRKGELQCV